jgi:TolB-like protein/cytochrome c-type biogenesis protein CcmH/NrfG
MMIEKILGPYRVLEKIGEGGMGEVYKARDTRLDRTVAIKVLPPAMLADGTARARLLREARLASQLNHPHICTVHDVGEADGQVYIAMELVEGQSLSARLAGEALPTEQVLRFGSQIADALAHAHAHGVVHRDLKSANVVITPEGRAKVLDFGLAKRLDEQNSDEITRLQASLTEPGMVVGTLGYMAPEQLRGEAADARSDIWALGVMLYEMASGARPFQGQTGFSLTSAILKEPHPPLPASVPAEVGATIARCLEKEPGRRYQQAGEVRAALDATQAGTAASWAAWRYRLARHRSWALAAGALVLVGVLVALVALVTTDAGGLRTLLFSGSATAIKLAVLPFENRTGDPEQEYFSDGMTDEMIAQLGRLHPAGLLVIARTSVMRYKKSNAPLDQIARELGVAYVLEGSARREAGRVRISAELIQARNQTQIWADSFERELSGILTLQSEVAKQVANALALKLLPAEQTRLANVRTVDPDAYDAYLKGVRAHRTLTRANLETAEQYFNTALKKDPTFALAWVGMARVWTGRQQMSIVPSSEAAPKAKAAILKALAFDENTFEAQRALAVIMTWTDWDWPAAERAWNKMLALNPNDADALAAHSHFLMHMGRQDEAIAEAERAVALDPFNQKVLSFQAQVLLSARRYDEAIAAARAAQKLQPDAPVAYTALLQAFFGKGMLEEAYAVEMQRFGGDPELKSALERGHAEDGYAGAEKRLADVLAGRFGKPGGAGSFHLANLYIHAGDRAHALEWLERAYELRDPNIPYLPAGPQWDSVRSDPRFQDLVRRIGLPQ